MMTRYWVGRTKLNQELAIADLSRLPAAGLVRVVYMDSGRTAVLGEDDLGPDIQDQLDDETASRARAAYALWQENDNQRAEQQRHLQQARAEKAFEDAEHFRTRLAQVREHLEKLRATELERYLRERKAEIASAHAEYLMQRGYAPAGLIHPRAETGLARQTGCWNCLMPLNSETYDLACQRCGWIACLCGACGCGHRKGCVDSAKLHTTFE